MTVEESKNETYYKHITIHKYSMIEVSAEIYCPVWVEISEIDSRERVGNWREEDKE